MRNICEMILFMNIQVIQQMSFSIFIIYSSGGGVEPLWQFGSGP